MRIVPRSTAVCGMMLWALPAWNPPIESPPSRADRRCATRSSATPGRLRADRHGIDARVRHRPVAAVAPMLMVDAIGRGHHRARRGCERPAHAGHVVHAEHLLDAEAIHETVVDHRLGRRAALLGRLEDDDRSRRRSCASRRDSAPRRAASRCGRRGRRRASCRDLARHRAGRSPRGSAARPCRRAGRSPCRSAPLAAADDADDAGPADAGRDLVAAEGAQRPATHAAVRCTSYISSGCWWKSRRQATVSAWKSAKRFTIGIRFLSFRVKRWVPL